MEEEDITDINTVQIRELFKQFSGRAYSSKNYEPKDEKVIDICIQLWKLDYKCEIVDNKNGSLCSTYPSRIIIPISELNNEEEISFSKTSLLSSNILFESQKSSINSQWKETFSRENSNNTLNKLNNDCEDNLLDKVVFHDSGRGDRSPTLTFSAVVAGTPNKKDPTYKNGVAQDRMNGSSTNKLPLREYFSRANLARCRYRFPVPAILYKGKYISRSATLSCFIEVIGKQFLHSSDNSHFQDDIEGEFTSVTKPSNDVDRARFYDIKLLEAIGTSSIFDLMVENKKVKYIMNVSSSEKADKENRYSKFSIVSIPYPGCEFFREFTDHNFNSSNLFYNWGPQFNNAALSLVDEVIPAKVANDWSKYKSWDLRKMTANYLKLILRYIIDEDSDETGFLIHCISGWDRTPLFVSLVRLSLWADGLVHSSLNAKQMLFFTLAYDWYVFGHQLPDRLKLNENILYFCFEFLEEVYKDSFMDVIDRRERRSSSESFVSAAYESATGGSDTPVSSFESVSSSSSTNQPHPASNPCVTLTKASLSQHHSASEGESSSWPFNKENGFSFDGISENESSATSSEPILDKDLEPVPERDPEQEPVSDVEFKSLRTSPTRSPLKERNKGSPKTPLPTGPKPCPVRVGNVNGFIRDFASSSGRRRKLSTTESPFKDIRSSDSDSVDPNALDANSEALDNPTGLLSSYKLASNPVPVPGERSRHSSSSSVGSWQLLSSSDPFKDVAFSLDSHRSSRASLLADMVDSTLTIKEETTPSSSLDSSQSIIVFNRQRRLTEVRDMFLKIYTEEVPTLYPESSLFTDLVQNICQKLGS